MKRKHSTYLKSLFASAKSLRETVSRCTKYLKNSATVPEFTHIACRGVSGMVVASPVAIRLRKRLIVVRKGEQAHCHTQTEGLDKHKFDYIVLDDLICTGTTLENIREAIHDGNPNANYVGAMLYNYKIRFIQKED